MLAVQFAEFGDPSVLHVGEVSDPGSPAGDQLLVRVQASSVNGTDLGLRRGAARIATWGRMPYVPGFDLSGEVVECGRRVTAFRPGDRVFALLGHRGGGQAERVLIRQGHAALAPRSCSPVAAAAVPLAGLTALQALHRHAGHQLRRPGARVLVIGASGGIGSFGVQLAKLAGAHVTGTASTPKLGFVADIGAHEVLDHHRQDLPGLDQRFDVILDSPGQYGFTSLRHLLTPDGVLVSTRPVAADTVRSVTVGALVPEPLRRDRRRAAAVMTSPRSQDLTHLADLLDSGHLRAHVDRSYPMSEAAAAHRHAEGKVTGKVVFEGRWD